MSLNAKSGIDTPFKGLSQERERPADDEIEQGDDRIDDHRLECCVRHELTGARQLDETDDCCDRCALDELHRETDGWRDRDTRGLRQDDVPKLLGQAKREATCRLPLRLRNSLNRAAPDFAEEGARVERE